MTPEEKQSAMAALQSASDAIISIQRLIGEESRPFTPLGLNLARVRGALLSAANSLTSLEQK